MVSVVKNLKGLERELIISFESKDIEPTINSKLINLSKSMNIKGFRKGKVPINIVKSKYYEQCFNESLSEHIEKSYIKVLLDEKLNPVSAPKISMEETNDKNIYKFKALIEVMPEIKIININEINLVKPVTKINKKDLEKAVEKISEQYKEWSVVDRKAKFGDRIKIDFCGKIDEKDFENNKADDFFVEIGSKQLIPGFELGLVGLSKGEEKILDIEFPVDYHDKKLASQSASFNIKVKEVCVGVNAEINQEFIKKLGIEDGSLSELYIKIEHGMKKDAEIMIESFIKKNVILELIKSQTFDIPKSLVHEEIQRIANENNLDKNVKINFEEAEKLYSQKASDNVKAGLLLREIINNEKLHPSKEDIDNWIDIISHGQTNRS